MQIGGLRQTFTVPVTAAQYAPEVMDITAVAAAGISEISALIESLPTNAAIELWLLRLDGDSTNTGHFVMAKSWNTIGLQDLIAIPTWRGAQLRAKSGGTSGSAIVTARFD